MKLFRNLFITVAAISSFGSMAGVIKFNLSKDAIFHTVKSVYQNGNFEKFTFQETLNTTAVARSNSLSFDNLNASGATGIERDYCGDDTVCEKRTWYYGNLLYADSWNGAGFLCQLAGLPETLCPFSAPSERLNLRMVHSHGTDLLNGAPIYYNFLSAGFYKSSPFYFDQETNSWAYSQLNTYFVIGNSDFGGKPIPEWGVNYEIPESKQFLDWLLTQAQQVNVYHNLSVVHLTCLPGSGCETTHSESYNLQQSGSISMQTSDVSTPTTASFLLLGVAGLALRRRLVA